MNKVLKILLFLACFQAQAMDYQWGTTEDPEAGADDYPSQSTYGASADANDVGLNSPETSWSSWARGWLNSAKDTVTSIFTDDAEEPAEPVVMVIHQNGEQPPLNSDQPVLQQEIHIHKPEKNPETFLVQEKQEDQDAKPAPQKPILTKKPVKSHKLGYICLGMLGIGLTWYLCKYYKKYVKTA